MKIKSLSIEGILPLTLDLVIGLTAFAIPFFISGPQWLTGTIVNTLLFIVVIKLPKKSLLPVIILPSIGAFAHGILFGPLTIFLFYFLPFIWIGNSILITTFSYLQNKTVNAINIIIASTLKSIFLFIIANAYFHFHIVPKVFITSMGFIQFITAVFGGFIALFILKLSEKNYE